MTFIATVFLCSCSTKVTTFYDVDKRQVHGNSNTIYMDGKVKFISTFLLYSEASNLKKYVGILVDLDITKDSLVNIEKADFAISPSKNGEFINPRALTSSNLATSETVTGKDFNAIKAITNRHGSDGIAIYFKTDVTMYDTLYLRMYFKYNLNDKHIEIRKTNTYLKGYFRQPFSR